MDALWRAAGVVERNNKEDPGLWYKTGVGDQTDRERSPLGRVRLTANCGSTAFCRVANGRRNEVHGAKRTLELYVIRRFKNRTEWLHTNNRREASCAPLV